MKVYEDSRLFKMGLELKTPYVAIGEARLKALVVNKSLVRKYFV